jgi:hypothetical protein
MDFMLFSRVRTRRSRDTHSILEGGRSAKDIVLNGLEERESILGFGFEVS